MREQAKCHLLLPITPPPSPRTPPPWKNCLPRNWSLVPKRLGTAVLGHLGEKESRTPTLRGAKLLCPYYPGLQFTSPPVDGAQPCLRLVPPGKSGGGGRRGGHERPPPSQAWNFLGLVG